MTAWTTIASRALLGCALQAPLHAAEGPRHAAAATHAMTPFAVQAAPADLPPNEQAQVLIDSDPSVVKARHALEAAGQRGVMLTTGPYEWTVRTWVQRRRYRSGAPDGNEGSAGLERTLRIGGKAALDRQLGEAQVRLAEARLGEARHESARTLLALWLNWLAADRARPLWNEQLGFAESNLLVSERRRRAGDASRLEQNAARADLAEVQRQSSTAANEEAKAHAKLRARFPQLDLQPRGLSEPMPLIPGAAQWRERILDESDLLRTAREELRRAELAAARARADRMPDPTLGVHVTSEGSGLERMVGMSLSIPLGGKYRDAQIREALQNADVARAAVESSRRELEAEIGENLADASSSLERWKFAEQAVVATRDNAHLTQRAYVLGEAELQSVLLSRRQLVDATLGAAQARIDALRARYKLLIDAHLIWGLHDD